MWRVYISSTYLDLKEQRSAVRDAIMSLNHYPVGMEDYAASDERPLDKCARDVRTCNVYICVVAWRYGFCPNGGQKSITEFEYEAAKEAGVNRLVFLLDESAGWPKTKIPDKEQAAVRRFRELLGTETICASFVDASSLGLAVTKALATAIVNTTPDEASSRVDTTLPVPDLLPYLCDRSDQEFALSRLVADAAPFPQRPVVAIIHSDDTEPQVKFLERLQKDMLPKAIGNGMESIHVKHYPLGWPTTPGNRAELHERLVTVLSNAVFNNLRASREQINQQLAANLSVALVHCHVQTENFLRDKDLVRDFLSFWEHWPDLQVGQVLVVSLFVKYQTNARIGLTPRVRSARRQHDEIRKSLEEFDFKPLKPRNGPDVVGLGLIGRVLPELQGSTLNEAQDWAMREEVEKFRDPQELIGELATLYHHWVKEKAMPPPVRIPTEHLAPKLREMLSRSRRIA